MIIVHTMGLDIGELPMSPRDIYMRVVEYDRIHMHQQHSSAVVLSDPVALSPDQARELASWLIKLAGNIDADRRGFATLAHPHDLAFDYTNPFHSAPLVTDAVADQLLIDQPPYRGQWIDN